MHICKANTNFVGRQAYHARLHMLQILSLVHAIRLKGLIIYLFYARIVKKLILSNKCGTQATIYSDYVL